MLKQIGEWDQNLQAVVPSPEKEPGPPVALPAQPGGFDRAGVWHHKHAALA